MFPPRTSPLRPAAAGLRESPPSDIKQKCFGVYPFPKMGSFDRGSHQVVQKGWIILDGEICDVFSVTVEKQHSVMWDP